MMVPLNTTFSGIKIFCDKDIVAEHSATLDMTITPVVHQVRTSNLDRMVLRGCLFSIINFMCVENSLMLAKGIKASSATSLKLLVEME